MMDPKSLIATIGVVALAVLASAYILVEDDDNGSSDTYRITFNANGGSGGYHIDVIPDTTYYMPTATLAHAEKSGCCLVGWSCNGQFYEIGAGVKGVQSDVTYDAVWTEGTAIQMNMGTWSQTFSHSPSEAGNGYDRERIKSASITIKNYPGTISSAGQIERDSEYVSYGPASVRFSFTPSTVGTYFISVDYLVRYSSGYDTTEGDIFGEFNFDYQTEKRYSHSYIVTFVDPVKNSLKEISWNVNGNILKDSQVLGNTITVPAAGELDGTGNLAWWTVNYYGTGDIYILPGTRIPVEEGKNLDFMARMHDAGQGAIGYDFRGGQSTSVQIANIYDVGSEIILPSDITLSGYHLAGWTASFDPTTMYLPGTVIGPSIPGKITANTDSNYIEMRAVWVRDSEVHHSVTFQNTDGASVSSAFVPHGAKVYLPAYGFNSLSGELEKWTVNGNELDPGRSITVDSDLVINAKYPEAVSPFDTCTVVFLVGDAQTNMASAVLNKGDSLILPKIDKAYHVFCYWYEANGTIWQSGDVVNNNILLYAKWEKIFDLSTEGNTVSLDVKAGYDYEISWGDGTYGDENSRSHTYPENSRGKLTVKMLDGDYAGQTAWAIYQIGSVTPVDPIDPVPVPNPEPQPMPEPRPEPDPEKDDITVYYIVGGAIAAIFGLIVARRFI